MKFVGIIECSNVSVAHSVGRGRSEVDVEHSNVEVEINDGVQPLVLFSITVRLACYKFHFTNKDYI